MSSTRRTLLCWFGVSLLAALPLACASEASPLPEASGSSAAPFEIPIGCSECTQNEICKMPIGACEQSAMLGACVARPQLCPLVLMPVCGCDGVTYNNGCEALRAGVNIAYERACNPFFCGGSEGLGCGPNEYCAAADCGALGFCVDRPTSCGQLPEAATPVCGCDHKDYASACEAHAAGVTVLAANKCPVRPWVPSAAPVARPPHSRTDQVQPPIELPLAQ